MSKVLIGLVGDLLVNRPNPEEAFRHVRDLLKSPAVLFGNLEGAYTDHAHTAPGMNAMISGSAAYLDVFPKLGFNVVSLANNHILDVGSEAMLENRDRLRANGVATCGAGESLEDARKPAIMEAGGMRIAFLGYASIFPHGYEAYSRIPGIAPMRAYDFWRPQMPRMHMPGVAPVASTVPDQGDMANLAEDIRRARGLADIVVTSFHWGDQARPFHISDHERRTARYCIDNGADMVIGHHHHTIRGIEWYQRKPIFYGLGHFVFDFRLEMTSEELKKFLLELSQGGEWNTQYVIGPRQGWPWLPMHEDMRMTMFGWALAGAEGITDIGVLPCRLMPDGAVQALKLGSAESDGVVRYLEQCNHTQGFNSELSPDGAIEVAGYNTLRVTAQP